MRLRLKMNNLVNLQKISMYTSLFNLFCSKCIEKNKSKKHKRIEYH